MKQENDLIFLKLGGSLITDKNSPFTARNETIARLAQEIARAHQEYPLMRLVLGHGSGSFGHVPAKQYQTREGVATPHQWHGFLEVWKAAHALDQLVLDVFIEAGLPVIPFSPSACVLSRDRKIAVWDIQPIEIALSNGLIPLVHGDVVFDSAIGGTIFSTEELFAFLAPRLLPKKILLAGCEEGVWKDFPASTQLMDTIRLSEFAAISTSLGQSASVDVTGGMLTKVEIILAMLKETPKLQGLIFSGLPSGNVFHALSGEWPGTRLIG
jgi:isopentenyl phosphate kinase